MTPSTGPDPSVAQIIGDGVAVPPGFQGRLRRWLPEDAPCLVTAWRDPDIARWNAVPPEPSLELATHWIANDQHRLDHMLSVDLVIDMDDHGVVGEVGLSNFNQQHRGALIGYWLLPTARGQGIAARAVGAVTDWALRDLGLSVVVAQCAADNLASHAVVGNAGFTHERTDSSGSQLWRRHRQMPNQGET